MLLPHLLCAVFYGGKLVPFSFVRFSYLHVPTLAFRFDLIRVPLIVRCVGECGLDYSEGFPSATLQLPWFEKQVELACKVSDDIKPIFGRVTRFTLCLFLHT